MTWKFSQYCCIYFYIRIDFNNVVVQFPIILVFWQEVFHIVLYATSYYSHGLIEAFSSMNILLREYFLGIQPQSYQDEVVNRY